MRKQILAMGCLGSIIRPHVSTRGFSISISQSPSIIPRYQSNRLLFSRPFSSSSIPPESPPLASSSDAIDSPDASTVSLDSSPLNPAPKPMPRLSSDWNEPSNVPRQVRLEPVPSFLTRPDLIRLAKSFGHIESVFLAAGQLPFALIRFANSTSVTKMIQTNLSTCSPFPDMKATKYEPLSGRIISRPRPSSLSSTSENKLNQHQFTISSPPLESELSTARHLASVDATRMRELDAISKFSDAAKLVEITLDRAKQLATFGKRANLWQPVFWCWAVIICQKADRRDLAPKLLEFFRSKDIYLNAPAYGALIALFANSGDIQNTFELYAEMEKTFPESADSKKTLISLLRVSLKVGHFSGAKSTLQQIKSLNLPFDNEIMPQVFQELSLLLESTQRQNKVSSLSSSSSLPVPSSQLQSQQKLASEICSFLSFVQSEIGIPLDISLLEGLLLNASSSSMLAFSSSFFDFLAAQHAPISIHACTVLLRAYVSARQWEAATSLYQRLKSGAIGGVLPDNTFRDVLLNAYASSWKFAEAEKLMLEMIHTVMIPSSSSSSSSAFSTFEDVPSSVTSIERKHIDLIDPISRISFFKFFIHKKNPAMARLVFDSLIETIASATESSSSSSSLLHSNYSSSATASSSSSSSFMDNGDSSSKVSESIVSALLNQSASSSSSNLDKHASSSNAASPAPILNVGNPARLRHWLFDELLRLYCDLRMVAEIEGHLNLMLRSGEHPTAYTFALLGKFSLDFRDTERTERLFERVRHDETARDKHSFLWNGVIGMHINSGRNQEAEAVFLEMEKRCKPLITTRTINYMIQNNVLDLHRAKYFFETKMQEYGLQPNLFSYGNIIESHLAHNEPEEALRLLEECAANGFIPNDFIRRIFVNWLQRTVNINAAEHVRAVLPDFFALSPYNF